MEKICILRNAIQNYAWGSHTAIAELLGEPSPSKKPQAELWMGAHPKAPSEVLVDGTWRPLPDLIREHPDEILGKRVAKAFDGKLPFLFKVLAAAQPLSIQAHPNLEQARQGFARENAEGIPLTAPHRCYKDGNHKPETLCALTPFWAMNGFRKIDSIVSLLREIGADEIAGELAQLEAGPDSNGLKQFFSALMTMDKTRQQRAAEQAAAFAADHAENDPIFEWMGKLNAQYPGDIGVLSPALLNLVCLEPGQAMFLRAGRLHAYLDGVGIELMANSDNVLRGGLTPKHIDVPELLKTLTFGETTDLLLSTKERPNAERVYPSEADEFRLSVITVSDGASYAGPEDRNVEILICTEGRAVITGPGADETQEMAKGVSVLVPAALDRYVIEGDATLYKAAAP